MTTLKLSEDTVTIELNKLDRIDNYMFSSLQSIVDYYKDAIQYRRKEINKFIQCENILIENDISRYSDEITSILIDAIYQNKLRIGCTISFHDLIDNKVEFKKITDKGKFIKRIKKFLNSIDSQIVSSETYYQKNYYTESDYVKFKIEESYIQKINVLINSKISDNKEIIFDISNEDYQPGLYNEDRGSCWWSTYDSGRLHFLNNDGFSLRRYKKNDNGYFYPMGRVWGYIDYIKNNESLVLFNLYDNDFNNLNKYGELIIQALKSLTNKDYLIQDCYLDSPHGNNEQYLWINGDRGIVISELDNGYFLKNNKGVEFKLSIFDNYEDNSYEYYCENCNEGLYEDDAIYSEYDGCIYCRDCYNRYHDTCIECGESFHNNELTNIGSGYDMVCQSCLNDNYFQCENCNEITHINECHYNENDGCDYCHYCYSELFKECENCNNLEDKNNLLRVKTGYNEYLYFCPDCIDNDKNINKCYLCGIYCDNLQLTKIHDKYYCTICELRIKNRLNKNEIR